MFRQQVISHLNNFDGESTSAFLDRMFSSLRCQDNLPLNLLRSAAGKEGQLRFPDLRSGHWYDTHNFAHVQYAKVGVFTRGDEDQRSDFLYLEKTFRIAFQRAHDRLQKRGRKGLTSNILEEETNGMSVIHNLSRSVLHHSRKRAYIYTYVCIRKNDR